MASRPSASTATPHTESVWPWRVGSSRPVSTSHTFSVRSQEAETARRPSSLIVTPRTRPVCPWSVRSFSSRAYIPQLQRMVIRSRDGAPPVPSHRHAIDPVCVAFESSEFAPCFHIPHFQRVVPRSGDGAPPVCRYRHPTNHACMAFEGAEFAPCFHIPHLQRGVTRSG